MADSKLTGLTELAATPTTGDMVYIVDDPGGTPLSKKITVDNLSNFVAADTQTFTNKTIDANGTGNAISNIDVADLANGTDGELITWDASAAPAVVATGTVGQLLTSGGAGVAPTFTTVAGGQTLYDCVVDAAGNGDYLLLNAAVTAGEKFIYIRNGTYAEDAAISLSSDMMLVGESREHTIINVNGISGKIDLATSINDIIIQNLTISNGGVNTDYVLDQGTGSTNFAFDFWIENCRFENGGVRLGYGGSNSRAYNLSFRNNEFETQTGTCCYIGSNTSTKYGFFLIEGNKYDGGGTFFDVRGEFTWIRFNDNTSITTLTSSNHFNITDDINDAVFSGNIFSGGQNSIGIGDVENSLSITGNSFYTPKTGVICSLGVDTGAITITGNSFYGATTQGISFSARGDGSTVVGNLFSGCVLGVNIGNSISDKILIASNNFIGNTTNISDSGTLTTISSSNKGLSPVDIKEYEIMKNTSGGQLVAGDLVTFKAVAAGNEFTTTTTQGDDLVYGMVAETIADTASGSVQTLGKTVVLKVDGTTDIAVGDFIGTFTSAGIGMKAGDGDMAIAIALEAYTTDDSAGVIDALLITPRKMDAAAAGGLTGTTVKTIGSTGDYLDVAAFIAGESTPYHGVLVSDVTEDSGIAVDGVVVLDLDRYTLTMGTNQFTYAAAANVTVFGKGVEVAEIDYSPTTGNPALFANDSFITSITTAYGFTFDNNSSATNAKFSQGVERIHDLRVELPDTSNCGFFPSGDGHIYSDIEFVGGGTSCTQAIKVTVGKTAIANNLTFTGGYKTTGSIFSMASVGSVFSNITFNHATNACQVEMTGGTLSGVKNISAQDLDLLLIGNTLEISNIDLGSGDLDMQNTDQSQLSNCTSTGLLDMSGTSCSNNRIVNCSFDTVISIAGDNNKISNSRFIGGGAAVSGALHNIISTSQFGVDAGGGALTFTFDSGANTNILTSCISDAAVVDNGTSNTIANNIVH